MVRRVKTPVARHLIVSFLPLLSVPREQEGDGRLTDGKNKSPPAHVEWKSSRNNNHHDSNNKPDDREAPEDKS